GELRLARQGGRGTLVLGDERVLADLQVLRDGDLDLAADEPALADPLALVGDHDATGRGGAGRRDHDLDLEVRLERRGVLRLLHLRGRRRLRRGRRGRGRRRRGGRRGARSGGRCRSGRRGGCRGGGGGRGRRARAAGDDQDVVDVPA